VTTNSARMWKKAVGCLNFRIILLLWGDQHCSLKNHVYKTTTLRLAKVLLGLCDTVWRMLPSHT